MQAAKPSLNRSLKNIEIREDKKINFSYLDGLLWIIIDLENGLSFE